MMKFKSSEIKSRLKHPKLVIILPLVGLVLIALGVYSYLSYQEWQTLDQHSQASASHLKSAIDSSLGAENPSGSVASQIDTIVTDFNKQYGNSPCQASSLYNWQTIIPAIKDIQTSCTQRSASSAAVITALKPLSQFLKDTKTAADALTAAITATTTPTDYAVAAKSWQDLPGTLPKTDTFKTTADKITEVAASISTAYAAIVAASTNEDKAAFDTAVTSLKTAYEAIPSIQPVSLAEQTTHTTAVTDAYKKL